MKILRNKKILVISPEPWLHNFISKHHYAITLAKRDNTVFFLNPPTDTDRCNATAYAHIFTVDYKPFVRGLNLLPRVISRWASARDVRKISALAKTGFDVIWSFDPYRFQFLDLFKAEVNIYFAADSHASGHRESLLADHAQLVLSPSSMLLNAMKTKSRKIFLNHGIADHFFNNVVTTKLPGKNDIKVGYVGNLQSKYLDYELLKDTIAINPSCDFIFAGTNSDNLYALKSFDNVFFAGTLATEKVPSFLQACDLLWLCYDTDQYRSEASNSHKIMEYLSSGKPVVSTRIDEYKTLPDLIITPENKHDLPALLKKVSESLNEFAGPALRERRKQFAARHTYDCQLDRVDEILAELPLNS